MTCIPENTYYSWETPEYLCCGSQYAAPTASEARNDRNGAARMMAKGRFRK